MTVSEQRDLIVAKLRRGEQIRQAGYREKALKLFPHVCGRCTLCILFLPAVRAPGWPG